MKVHSWFNTDSSFVTAPETLISPNLKHEKQQVCFCFQFFCSLGWVETIILIIQKRPAMHTEDAVRTRSLAALCSSSMGLHLINSARHRSWVCEELSRTPQLQKQAECHRQSVCCYLWAPALHPPQGELACLRLCLQKWRTSLLSLRFWYWIHVQSPCPIP